MKNMLMALGPGVLRLNGGNGWWTPGARVARSDSATVLVGADFDRLFDICSAANWTAIVGVNFQAGLSDTSAAEAAFVQARGGSVLRGVELGNEPDLGVGFIPGYSFSTYLTQVDTFLNAIQQRAPGMLVVAPATANDTVWFRQTIAHAPTRFALATHHHYSLIDDPGVPEVNFRYPTIAHLLSDTLLGDELALDKNLAAAARRYGLPMRMGELNTGDLGGKAGVSNVFASALWAVDHEFIAAEAGLAGVNFNMTLGGGFYGPFALGLKGALTARPMVYGMLAFADAARGQVLNLAATNSRHWSVTAHGSVTLADGIVRLAVVNKDTTTVPVRITVPGAVTVTVRRLTAGATTSPLTDSTGVTYAGASVTTSGTFTPVASETVTPVAGVFVVSLPSASAAVVVVTTK
jgi:hypothetical protein